MNHRTTGTLSFVCIPVLNQSSFDYLVSRFQAHSQNLDMDLTLDYNVELYPLRVGDRVSLVLATSLAKAGEGNAADEADDKDNMWRPDGKGKRGVEEDYDYVMYGKVCPSISLFFCSWREF